ncbi:MAG: hypothetical protein ACPGWR_13410 [Ardenticatenaceae bacterium]
MKTNKSKPKRIIRTRKNKNYFVASNDAFNDERLSWGARGILAYLLSKQDTWEVYKEDLYKRSSDKPNRTDRHVKELQECGYIRRYRTHDKEGKFVWLTEVYESPTLNPDFKLQKTSKGPPTQKPSSGKPFDRVVSHRLVSPLMVKIGL